MTIRAVVDECTPEEWARACTRFADLSIYQTWAFGEVSAADTNSKPSRIMVFGDDAIIGAAQVRIKRIPLLGSGLAYLYFGPMVEFEDSNPTTNRQVLECIKNEYAYRRNLQLRIVPNMWNEPEKPSMHDSFSALGFARKPASPYRTLLVDLRPDELQLRKNLAQKWRNGLNQSEKYGLCIEARRDESAMLEFEQLYDNMWSHKQFETGVSVSSFCHLQQLLPDIEKLTILLARRDGVLVAGHVSSTLGNTCIYLLGASNEAGRECKASYCLQWQTMVMAKKAGATWYDLGGIDVDGNPGVYHFKAGLGGKEVVFVGMYEARSNGIGQFLIPVAERAYRAFGRATQRKIETRGRAKETKGQEQPNRPTCPNIAKLSS